MRDNGSPRARFPLSSDQLELLLAFEAARSPAHLVEIVRRDGSVVSRNLQRLAEDHPVLTKEGGRWRLTDTGRAVNVLTRRYLAELTTTLPSAETIARDEPTPYLLPRAVLIVINAQKAMQDAGRGNRSNPECESNVSRLLACWRKARKPLVHVRHESQNPGSALHPSVESSAFIPLLAPEPGETVVAKSTASAFGGTTLAADLAAANVDALILTGFTASECIDATAKAAADLGFRVYVVGDATATFDLTGPGGQIYKASRVQEMTLAGLHATFAGILETEALLAALGP